MSISIYYQLQKQQKGNLEHQMSFVLLELQAKMIYGHGTIMETGATIEKN